MRGLFASSCVALLAMAAATAPYTPIKHVFVLQMENRAFDHMLGWLKRNNSAINGLDGSQSNPMNPNDSNSPVVFADDLAAYVDPDPGHEVSDTAQQIFGQNWWIANVSQHQPELMNGFIANANNKTGSWAPDIMKCFSPQDVPIISTLAMEFALVDNFFAAIPGPTYPNRLMTLSATTWGYGSNDDTRTILGWPQETIFGAMSASNTSWRVYFEDAATAWLFQDMRTASALSNFRLMTDFEKDLAAGDVPQFTFIDPAYFSIPGLVNASDQHPSHDVLDGERFMKRVYEAIRASPVWNNSVLMITYDEHGGFYDHVAPPTAGVPNPDGIPCNDCKVPFNFDRLGVRVPMIVVSPWVPKGQVISSAPEAFKPTPTSQMELSSIPATIHYLFNTSKFLTRRDAWATPLHWIWQNSGLTAPRTDCPETLPAVPAGQQTPSQANAKFGVNELSHLHQDLLHLVQGTFAGVKSPAMAANMQETAGITTEAAAGLWVRRTVASALQGVQSGRNE